jgi:hypothetical protein
MAALSMFRFSSWLVAIGYTLFIASMLVVVSAAIFRVGGRDMFVISSWIGMVLILKKEEGLALLSLRLHLRS